METKHTLGALEVSEHHEGEGYDILVEKDGEGNGWHEVAMHIENRADAVLFAAAPDMLGALKDLRGRFTAMRQAAFRISRREERSREVLDFLAEWMEDEDEMFSAIAKAKGG